MVSDYHVFIAAIARKLLYRTLHMILAAYNFLSKAKLCCIRGRSTSKLMRRLQDTRWLYPSVSGVSWTAPNFRNSWKWRPAKYQHHTIFHDIIFRERGEKEMMAGALPPSNEPYITGSPVGSCITGSPVGSKTVAIAYWRVFEVLSFHTPSLTVVLCIPVLFPCRQTCSPHGTGV